jgi:putative toxin-antitoxin system antitoxin component (TIGR02293 family)
MASLAFATPASPTEHVQLLRDGLPAGDAKQMLARFDLPIGQALAGLNIAVATFNRKVLRRETLAPDESERLLGMVAMIDQVQRMVEESGDPTGFDAANWLSRWLSEPVPALGGTRPLDWLDTMAGQTVVRQILARMQTGAYS